ncbi:MAG: Na/Pi cotransporter family protein, partial [Spirochaetales bacterium]
VNTALLVPFVGTMAKFVERMVPERARISRTGEYELALIAPNLPDALSSNLITIRAELALMSRHSTGMLQSVMDASKDPDRLETVRDELEVVEQRVDDMQEAITGFLTESMRESIGENDAQYIQAAQRIAHEIEGISDACFSIGILLYRLHKKGRRIHEDGDQEIFDYTAQVMLFLKYNEDILERKIDRPELEVAHELEDGIDRKRTKLRKRSRKSLERDSKADVRGELIFIDIVRHLEHIGDNCLNISQAIGQLD